MTESGTSTTVASVNMPARKFRQELHKAVKGILIPKDAIQDNDLDYILDEHVVPVVGERLAGAGWGHSSIRLACSRIGEIIEIIPIKDKNSTRVKPGFKAVVDSILRC